MRALFSGFWHNILRLNVTSFVIAAQDLPGITSCGSTNPGQQRWTSATTLILNILFVYVMLTLLGIASGDVVDSSKFMCSHHQTLHKKTVTCAAGFIILLYYNNFFGANILGKITN